ncbi:MAG: hypothetical protein CVU89_14260 [Firmicutes bacterium HGW-Firmicutes-14]|nr:MAG: hypothetical protein CVU89_14260 [Firmicutes bacterium HGW-Firmicutes-14]
MIKGSVKLFKNSGKGVVTMKRTVLILTVALILLLTASAAQAATKVHGGFSTDSSGCAACHITHAAEAANLLLTGTTQTEFCWSCHGSAKPKAPYDTINGAILEGSRFDYTATPWADWGTIETVVRASYTGGFTKTFKFESEDATVAVGAFDVGGAKWEASTTAHNVETITLGQGSAWNSANKIPGGTASVSGDKFVCSSCHDPHGYNSTAAGGGGAVDNPRLLRKDLPARSDIDVYINIDISVDGNGNMTEGTLRTTGYPDATINKWCGGCHDALDVGDNAGSDKDTDTRFRHAMGIAVPTPPANTDLGGGLPLATGDKLMCITCHRVHGSGATMSAVANSWTGQDYDNPGNANISKSGSALLRLDNRDVCYKCHDAARFNTNVGGTRQPVTY